MYFSSKCILAILLMILIGMPVAFCLFVLFAGFADQMGLSFLFGPMASAAVFLPPSFLGAVAAANSPGREIRHVVLAAAILAGVALLVRLFPANLLTQGLVNADPQIFRTILFLWIVLCLIGGWGFKANGKRAAV